MKLIVAAVSARPPDWVAAGWTEYAKRMPRELPLELLEIRPEPRTTGKTAQPMMTSSTSAPSMPARCTACCTAWPPSVAPWVMLNEPFQLLASGVRAVDTITADVMVSPFLMEFRVWAP